MTSPADRHATLAAMRARIDAAGEGLIEPGAPLALLGSPGDDLADSAAYLGELNWLGQRVGAPAHVGTAGPFNWLRMERRIREGAILLHGNVCFGDAASPAQALAEAVLWRYRGREVIQLPCRLSFGSDAAIDQAARVIDRHGAFTLMVSDRAGHDLATRRFACDVRLCPPMAFALPPLRRGAVSQPLLVLLHDAVGDQTRAESAEQGGLLVAGPDSLPASADTPAWRERRDAAMALLRRQARGPRAAIWRARAETRLHRGSALLRQAGFVITDRLDAHIACLLMDVPHCVVGHRDSTLAAFLDTWPAEAGDVLRAGSLPEALALYRALR